MANKDLFKQAIAEAKSIREAAIANAKEALEESLTPHLKDMLAAKLQEMDDSSVEEEVVNETEVVEEGEHSDEDKMEEEVEEGSMEDEEAMEEAEDDSEESEDEAEDAGEEETEDEEEVEVKDMEVDDLKDLIRDIIAQEMGDGGEEELGMDDMDAGAEVEPEGDMEVGAEDEEIDLDELLAELESATNEEVEEEVTEEVEEEVKEEEIKEEEIKEEDNSELNEALDTIQNLQNQLQEVNLLNAKLLYVNKVFKTNNLSEAQKVNIIAAFDKAETVKEVKLVFETVSDNVVAKKATKVTNESKLGMASKATGTTASKPEVISEVSDAVKRMQKLAGII
jgi:hypothetical protein